MNTKLTLTVEKSIIEQAKVYAQKTGRSLSDIVEHYLQSLSENDESAIDKMSPKLKKLFGAVNIPISFDHKKEIKKIMSSRKK